MIRSLVFALCLVVIALPDLHAQPVAGDGRVVASDDLPEYDALDLRERSRPRFDAATLAARVRYPDEARRRELEGRVVVGVLVDTNGAVVRTRVEMATDERLVDAAVAAVTSLSYTPGRIYRKPVRVWLAIPIDFSLK